MVKKLFLLDGMALVYRAHFAFISRPILTSKGVNTSALYGFTQTLLDILKNQQPTHLGVAFDTAAPTQRHVEFAEYKANREEMPEELSAALPHVRRMVEAFNVPVLICDGYEADDIIGTLVRRAEKHGFQSYMVTSDKDFGQLVGPSTFIYKPSRSGEGVEVIGLPEIQGRWGVQRPEQVVDVLALMGDASDNIPGVPGIGEKTAMKLIAQYGTVENLLAHAGELTGRAKQTLETNREQALLSKRLATIICDAPCPIELDALKVEPPDEEKLKDLLVEFEFNSIGRRLFGEDFKAGRGGSLKSEVRSPTPPAATLGDRQGEQLVLVSEMEGEAEAERARPPATPANLKTIADVPARVPPGGLSAAKRAKLIQSVAGRGLLLPGHGDHQPRSQRGASGRSGLLLRSPHRLLCPVAPTRRLRATSDFGPRTSDFPHPGRVPPRARIRPHREGRAQPQVRPERAQDGTAFRWAGSSSTPWSRTALSSRRCATAMDYLSEVYLGYTPIPISKLIGDAKTSQINMADVPVAKVAEYSAEDADVTWQLHAILEPLLKEKRQERVFYEVESPLIAGAGGHGVRGHQGGCRRAGRFRRAASKEMDAAEKSIYRLAGTTFNLNSPRQLGQVLFDVLKIGDAPKKTKTGQYATDEQTLLALATDHEIVQPPARIPRRVETQIHLRRRLARGDLAQNRPRPYHL